MPDVRTERPDSPIPGALPDGPGDMFRNAEGNGRSTSRCLLGDCLELLPGIPDKSIDLVLCDLPYGTTGCGWDTVIPLDRLWKQYGRILKPRGSVILTAVQPFTSVLVQSNPKWFKHEWIWHKSKSGSAFTARYRPMAKHESVLVFCRGSPKYNPQMVEGKPYSRTRKPPPVNHHGLGLGKNGDSTTVNEGTRYPDSVIYIQQKWRRQDQVHPTQKPVALMEYLIRTYTDAGDTVLDNCMGSGTTGVAAVGTGRKFIGMEMDGRYFEVARDRMSKAPGASCGHERQ